MDSNVEKFWLDRQDDSMEKFSKEQENIKNSYRDLWKSLITIHATILGISIALMGYLQKEPNTFLMLTWITEIVAIGTGLLIFKLHIDWEAKNSLDNFIFLYDINEIKIKESRGEFINKEKMKKGWLQRL